jgi:PleD family two-component response regulator
MIFEEEKYLFETASNIDEAYRLFETKRYSVIIIEYFPPFETTDRIIKWVKKNTPETYIIMITNALIEAETYEKLFEAGLDDLILKPFPPERVLVHVKKGAKHRDFVLRKQQLEAQPILDPMTQQIQQYIFNSIYFRKRLRQELKRAKRHNHPLSLLLVRVPGKEKEGRQLEKLCLELASILRKYVREEDTVGRENGNFGILLPDTDEKGSQALMSRLTGLIQAHPDFQSDRTMGPILQDLSLHVFTYPDMSSAPAPLRAIVDEIDKEPPYR